MRDERNALLTAAIDDLAPLDRQVVILRGVEGVSLAEASAIMGVAPNAIATRYHRALKKLRAAFPNGVLEELADD
jgi:RNA polymerase sigma factor (sigma-70 family)